MAASSFDVLSTPTPRKLRIALPRVRAAAYGGGFGLFVVALGLLAIGLGWNGMAGGGGQVHGISDLRAQLPWLVSGGILGLALVVFGTAMIVVHNARLDRARLEAKLDELIAATGRPAVAGGFAPGGFAEGGFVAGGTAFHAPTCRLVQGREDVGRVTAAEAEGKGLRPCRICKPA